MKDFLKEFGTYDPGTGEYTFSDVRSGLIVAMVSDCYDMRGSAY